MSGVVLSDIGSDMPEAVKTQAAKTVVPVIIVGQIIATPLTEDFNEKIYNGIIAILRETAAQTFTILGFAISWFLTYRNS